MSSIENYSSPIKDFLRSNFVWIFLLAIIAVSLIKRLGYLDPHVLSWDEVVYVTQAKEFAESGILLDFEPYRPPLWPFLMGLVFLVFGSAPIVIELFACLMGILMLLSFIPLYRRILGKDRASLSLLLTFSLPIIWLQVGGRVMSESLFLMMGNIFLMVVLPKILNDRGSLELTLQEGFIAGVSLGLATLARFTSFLYLLPVITILLLKRKWFKINTGSFVSLVMFGIITSSLLFLSTINTGSPIGFYIQYRQANSIDPEFSVNLIEPLIMSTFVSGYLLAASAPFALLGTIRGVLEKNKKSIMYVLWFFVPLALQGILRIDYYRLEYFDLGSGGLFVRLTFPWIVGGIMLATYELHKNRNRKRIFFIAVTMILVVNTALAGVVLGEYRTSTYYQEHQEVRRILDDIWDEQNPLITNWVVIIYPYGRELVRDIPDSLEEYELLLDQGLDIIVQHRGNRSIPEWWNPPSDGFSVAGQTSHNSFIIWSR